jgi:hypothetical protein
MTWSRAAQSQHDERRGSPPAAWLASAREAQTRPSTESRSAAQTRNWPTTSCARACGSSAATAGPTTSATAASTTSSPCSKDVNILVLDTEVYSNTGGQASKATPIGAVGQVRRGGQAGGKKDLGLMAMNYGNVYVASIAFGAKDNQTVKAFLEAESYDGPSLIIAYSALHRTRLRPGARLRPAGPRGGQRHLAAVPLRSAATSTTASRRW